MRSAIKACTVRSVAASVVCLLSASVFAEEWKLEPLGEPGTLKVQKTLPVQPKLRTAPPVRREALVLVDGKTTCAVVSDFKAPKPTGSHD